MPISSNLKKFKKELTKILESSTSIKIEEIESFMPILNAIDDLFFEDFGSNMFWFIVKPSTFCMNTFNYQFFSFKYSVRYVVFEIIEIYRIFDIILQYTSEKIIWIKEKISCNKESMVTPFILMENILSKWKIEVKKCMIADVFRDIKELEFSKISLIYSINGDVVACKITDLINFIICGRNLKRYSNITKNIKIPEKLFGFSKYKFYEIDVLDKCYLVKVLNLKNIKSFPSGLSTSYLNIKGGFTSLGYMGATNINDFSRAKFLFISVEEKFDDYLLIDNLELFVNNEKQIFDFLNILNNINAYKIKLMGPRIMFSVNKFDDDRWQFRLDNIGEFLYFDGDILSENHIYLINILVRLIELSKMNYVIHFLENFIRISTLMISEGIPDYIDALLKCIE